MTPNPPTHKTRGFTLVELLVSMSVTTVIITVLVSVTNLSMTSWSNSRDEVRTSRLAREALTIMADDLETLIVREGNSFQWFHAEEGLGALSGSPATRPISAVNLIFFSSAPDRYDGAERGTATHEGGDIATLGYKLDFKDPIQGAPSAGEFPVYSLYRARVDPRETFDSLLAQDDLELAFTSFEGDWTDSQNFLVENVFGLTITFTVEYLDTDTTPSRLRQERVVLGSNASGAVSDLRVFGNRLEVNPPNPQIEQGQIVGIDLSMTVLTETGVKLLRGSGGAGTSLSGAGLTNFLEDNSFQYSQSIVIPRR